MSNNIKEELILKDKRDTALINLVLDYAIKNSMSAKEVDECIDKARETFYSDGLIRRS